SSRLPCAQPSTCFHHHPLSLTLSSLLFSPSFFFFNHPPPPQIYPLPLHDALPISDGPPVNSCNMCERQQRVAPHEPLRMGRRVRSEEHTSELQSLTNLVCRLLLEKKKKTYKEITARNREM